jgi:tetratricopeptide (TPR) repeat protein
VEAHYTCVGLERLLFDPVDQAESAQAAQHLMRCDRCWAAAAAVRADYIRRGPKKTGAGQSLLLSLMEEDELGALAVLKARGWWAELKELTLREQATKVRSVTALQTSALFRVILGEAWATAPVDPHRGEQFAQLARFLAGMLPERRFPLPVRRDMEAEALTVVANCRRLLADWSGSAFVIEEALKAIGQGTGNSALEATLLSIRSLLATDTGHLESSLTYSARALDLYRSAGDWSGYARTAVVEAGNLLAGGRAEEAIGRATVALDLLPDHETKLELLARGVIVEAHIVLGRTVEAIHLFSRAQKTIAKVHDPGARLRISYLEACMLEALGSHREAEKLFSDLVQTYLDSELYKEAFITLLTIFEAYWRRGDLKKAAGVCEQAICCCRQAEGATNPQIIGAWKELLSMVHLGEIEGKAVSRTRHFLLRHWKVAAPAGFQAATQAFPAEITNELAPVPPPPRPPQPITSVTYQCALEEYDRILVAAALHQAGGNLSEASRLLGTTRTTLRAKLKRYGLPR